VIVLELKILNKEEFFHYIPSMNNLFESAFNKKIHPNFFEWRYLQNPNADLLVAVAILNDEIIANYSASPVLLTWKGDIFKTALSMTTMTHPEHNGKGLFTQLANMLYKEMEKKGFSTMWGFPNSNSHGVFIKKLDWKDIYEIPTLSLSVAGLSEICLTNSYTIQVDDNFELSIKFDANNSDKIIVKKNEEYYKWRYLNHPFNEYKNLVLINHGVVSGKLIYKIYNNSIDIVELQCNEDKEKGYMIDYLINNSINNRYDYIYCWENLFENSHTVLERKGFVNSLPVTYFGSREIITSSLTTNYKDWLIQMGDSDVY